ncbi:related to exopolygalacturonase [Phialocephala subalpina]|uniref:Related to exopolygalacturonase n=1 Tax=Phialocephala subalpina TaxID=576137 RepID=A0A1L7XSR0_9HELO|nr:related to exopolygalacturonase [Phialocephala subalpina]
MFISSSSPVAPLFLFGSLFQRVAGHWPSDPRPKTCIVEPCRDGSDDAPAVIKAFEECGKDGRIIFLNETYHINSIMNTTSLDNCEIDLRGTLLWSTDIPYWLSNSMPVGYQNQSSAWIFGGNNVYFKGHGYGTIGGNGQIWYDFNKGTSNYPRRPHAITVWQTTNSLFEGIRFVQSRMWTMTVIHSENVLLQDIYVNSTSSTKAPTVNTDGVDTIYANNITFKRWSITNGDDSISSKANSTNIHISNCTFYQGIGFALGSIGQYNNTFERIENFTAEDVVFHNTLHAAYIKTWTGQPVGYPPNGGGGGIGYVKNVVLKNFQLNNVQLPTSITQCISFSSASGNCNTSLFKISDITLSNLTGTTKTDPIASFQCSAAAPCENITLTDINLTLNNGTTAYGWNCDNLEGSIGFNCTGHTCGTASADGTC